MSDSVRTNIFIAHTPLQNFIASKIVKQYFNDSGINNMLYTTVAWKNKEHFNSYHFINKNSFFSKTVNTYMAKKEIGRILKSRPCNLFIPHTSALLDNYFFYSFPREKYGVRINFYYEGILYFYEYHEPFIPKVHLKRKWFALLCGFVYKRNPTIFPEDSSGIYKIYSILPEFTIGPAEKITKVSILEEDYIGKENCALIIGGKPKALDNSEMISLYELMIQKILSNKRIDKIYFKGHHADQTTNFEDANKGLLKVDDITQNSPVEEVIARYKPSLVVSYPSSALVSLKSMYEDKIEISSYYIDEKKEHLNKLWPIFEKLQIQLTLI
ncbi:polysialyltransferase family glycosyltransferase [Poritiphilus flavus]|uniref:Glycosyltransferase family 52 n=1 Tax=Poritiphilus flavus TaxID=2697053 RepID=A0A6L9E8P6_9FLAO|nr:polysialyltransferase family glycosyltransferase [Poritiphilus flavus]NAS10973.1 hypothetical protein [Poritiphilus flavus]